MKPVDKILAELDALTERDAVDLVEYIAARQLIETDKRVLRTLRRAVAAKAETPYLAVVACVLQELRGRTFDVHDMNAEMAYDAWSMYVGGYDTMSIEDQASFKKRHKLVEAALVEAGGESLDSDVLAIHEELPGSFNVSSSPLDPIRTVRSKKIQQELFRMAVHDIQPAA